MTEDQLLTVFEVGTKTTKELVALSIELMNQKENVMAACVLTYLTKREQREAQLWFILLE
jgi:hypothetical protein